MDEHTLLQALQALDARLTAMYDVVIVGGAAMILYFGARRVTRDIDVVVLRGDLGVLRKTIREVAGERDMSEDWMSDAAKGFTNILLPDFAERLVPLDFSLRYLRLYVLGRAEQAAMKIVALRERDLEDLDVLLPAMSVADKQTLIAVMHHVGISRPDWAQKIRYFLQEQGWETETP